ncbi:MAG: type II toxin-antitoxin system VapC family toxin [Armatimonadetes bacterium]|nr:type II toxin-antitoxin system VapC family toxin [Armatimonadota bacterium]
MRLLLDTHVFLWFIAGDSRLQPAWRDAIRDPANIVFVSVASVWEAVVKHGIGKLPMAEPPASLLPRQRTLHGLESLPIDEDCVRRLAELADLHKDPFDRIIVAQALHHDLTIVTTDSLVRGYPAPTL